MSLNNKKPEATLSNEQKWLLLSLTKSLGIEFSDLNILYQAFAHSSLYQDKLEKVKHSNQRLEFLGDSVLSLIICTVLYKTYPLMTEGELAERKSYLVSESVLFEIAISLDLSNYLMVSKGENSKKQSLLADSIEAFIGAIYLDKGLDVANSLVLGWFKNHLEDLDAKKFFNNNYKTVVNEYSQKNYKTEPVYEVIKEIGVDHFKTYYIKLLVNNNLEAVGEGLSKQKAEQDAAKNFYEKHIGRI